MATAIERQVRFLQVYAVVATLVGATLFILTFSGWGGRRKFDEIDVGRINVVESDGQLRMVISNKERQHPGIINGKVIKRDYPRPPGIIFFDQAGDEMGGLIYGENGDRGHFGSITFDKVLNDQALGFRYLEGDNGKYSAGIDLWQQPDIPLDSMLADLGRANAITDDSARQAALQAMTDKNELTTRRLFLGKGRDDATTLEMSDIKGRPRIKMTVDADGAAGLEFLDDTGEVVYRIPEKRR
jgi:hypothetical protein